MERWLIAYDIADPDRLRAVHGYLKRRAVHLQYSVFVAKLGPAGMGDLLDDLRALIAEDADDIRIYRIPATPWWQAIGRRPLPESLELLGGPLPSET